MPRGVDLSENAFAVLRFEIKGWRPKNQESRLPAYRELVAAGVMEPVPGSDWEYRFTEHWSRTAVAQPRRSVLDGSMRQGRVVAG
jgi:hypothetical protein